MGFTGIGAGRDSPPAISNAVMCFSNNCSSFETVNVLSHQHKTAQIMLNCIIGLSQTHSLIGSRNKVGEIAVMRIYNKLWISKSTFKYINHHIIIIIG